MKSKSILTHFWKAVLGISFIHGLASAAQAQNTVTISRPTNTMYYEHDRTNCVHIHNTTSTYNANGWLLSSVNTDPVTNQNLTKTKYAINSLDKVDSITDYLWQNNAWKISNQSSFLRTYNAANKVTEFITQFTVNGTLKNDRKINYVYNAAGKVIEETNWRWLNNTWENDSRTTLTYTNGILTERLVESYNKNSSTWIPAFKYTYAGWHATGGHHTSFVLQNYQAATGWKNMTRSTITIGQNGSYEEIQEGFQNGNWQYSTRTNYTYDSQGNTTDFLMEDYINGTWRMVWIDKQIFTYSPQNDMLEKIWQGQDSTYGPKRDQTKEVYSNFQYFTRTLGTPEIQKTALALKVYPNPATDKIQIELTETKPQALTATVSDITGKTWQTKTFKPSEVKQLNIETLPKGIYMLQLQTETGSTVKRIVKQ